MTISPASEPSLELPALLDRIDHFRLDGLVPGEYIVSLPFTGVLPVRVHVVAGQRAQVRLAMPARSVALVVHSATCKHLRLELDDATQDVVFSHDCDENVFGHVPPGAYRVCVDDTTCRPVLVTAEPAEQTVDVR